MPHIDLPDLPGIRALMSYRPETSRPLNELVEVLLRGPSTLTRGERELIATVVSSRNECRYCCSIHGAVAAQQLEEGEDVVEKAKQNLAGAALSEKMKALLTVAGQVQLGGKNVSERDIAKARGMKTIAEQSGLGRESLYKAFAPGAKPRFETILKVLSALGVSLQVKPPKVA